MSIRIRTILIISLTVLLIVSFSIMVVVITVNNAIEASQQADLTMMANIADRFISSEIRGLRDKITGTAFLFSIFEEHTWQENLSELESQRPELLGMAILSRNGDIIAEVGLSPDIGKAMENRHVQDAFEGQVRISTSIISSDNTVFYLAAPIPKYTDTILLFTLPGLYFSEVVSGITIWETGQVVIVDSQGYVLANIRINWVLERFNSMLMAEIDPSYELQAAVTRRASSGETGIGFFSVADIPRMSAFRPISASEEGWGLSIIAPLHESPFREIDIGLYVVGFVSLFLSLIAAVVASGFIKKPFDEVAILKEEAEKHSRFKSDFLANMSHEMRTPLTAVLGLTELTLGTVQLDDETHSNLVKVYRSGETLLNLINDILDISKIEANKLELHPREYDVPSLVNDTISQSVLYIGEKPIELILDINEDMPNYLYGDELRIRQILNNLLSNAFKFTREGTVEFGMRCSHEQNDSWLIAWVKDTGIGIKTEDMGKLFTLYATSEEVNMRGGINTSRRTEGTGLGLSISKRVAEMMDGNITVESEYQKGSTFTVRLKQKFVNNAVIGIDVAESLKKFDYSLKKFDSLKMTRINMSYARVLIVDDNPTNLDVAKGLMGIYGMKIDCVTSGQQAIDAIRSEKVKYTAIFMDHMMPEMDGIEAVRIIREHIGTEYSKTVPIIALTANAIVGNEEMFLSKGFQAFISKPIDLARLDTVLRQWVRDKDAEALLPKHMINIVTGSPSEREILLDDIPGLDIDKGIAHFGYSEEAYVNVLQSFVKNTGPLLDIIEGVNADNLDIFAVTVHGIKGASRGILARNIANKAEALEKAAIAGDYNFINSTNPRFLGLIKQLLSDIEDTIYKSGKNDKPVKDKPDAELLAGLLKAAENFDIDEIDAIMAKIESHDYNQDDGLASWLRNNVDQGKYKVIAEKLLALQNNGEV